MRSVQQYKKERDIYSILKSRMLNFSQLAFGELSSKAFGFLTMVYLANTVGADQFGMIGFVVTVASYVILVANFGIEHYAAQKLSSVRAKDDFSLLGHVISTRVILSSILIIPFIVFGIIYAETKEVLWLIIFQSIFILANAFSLQFYFISQKKIAFLAAIKVLTAAIILFATWMFIKNAKDLPLVTLVSGVTTFVLFFITLGIVLKKNAIRFSIPSLSGIGNLLRNSAPLGISAFMIQIYYSADIVFLGFINPGVELGYYTGAYRLILILTMISGFLYQIFLPDLAKLSENYFQQSQTRTYIGIMICSGGIVSAVSYIWSYDIIKIVLGSEYIPAQGVYHILLINVIMVFVNVSFGSLLIVWNRHKEYLFVVTTGAVTNVISNIILIPQYGIYGAAISTVTAECAVFLTALYFNQKLFGLFNPKKAAAL